LPHVWQMDVVVVPVLVVPRNDQHRYHYDVHLPNVRQDRRPVLQQQQLHGCRRSMHLFKRDQQILVPGLRRRQPALLLELDKQHDRVQRRRHGLR